MIFCTWNGVTVVCVLDITNPSLLQEFDLEMMSIMSAIVSEDYLFVYAMSPYVGFYVFDIKDPLQPKQLFVNFGFFPDYRNIYYNHPYIYVNNGFRLTAFDVSNGFEEVFTHGNITLNKRILHSFSNSDNDFYIMKLEPETSDFKIYSTKHDKIVSRVNIGMYGNDYPFFHWKIENNYLYLLKHPLDTHSAFYIFELNNDFATLLNRTEFQNNRVSFFSVYNDQVFFYNAFSERSYVYDIVQNTLVYNGTFFGTTQQFQTNRSNQHIMNTSFFDVIFRDIYDYRNEIMNESVSFIADFPIYYDENHIIVQTGTMPNTFVLYRYNIEDKSMTFMNQWEYSFIYGIHNRIISFYDHQTHITEYRTLRDGQIVTIGEKKDFKNVEQTYFFFNVGKMVQVSWGGVWVYDIEFTEHVSETDTVVVNEGSRLLGNFPNPFNPYTSIRYQVSGIEPENVRIDVFNIRGQLVKTLINEIKEVGEHTVTWYGVDQTGNSVSSGVYFYRMETNTVTEIRRMVLIK